MKIPVNLGDVESFSQLPVGSYESEVIKVKYVPTEKEGKFPQLQVTYQVTQEEGLGKTTTEFLSMSPRAAFRLKRFFEKFGYGEEEELEIDDETELLVSPNIEGIPCLVLVKEDGVKPDGVTKRFRTELVETYDDQPAPQQAAQANEEPEEAPAPRRPRPTTQVETPVRAVPARRTLR